MARCYARACAVWLVMACAEVAHGVARNALLAPVTGEFRAGQIGVFSGSLIILGVALAFARWLGATSRGQLARVGLLWLLLMLGFEVLAGRYLANRTWERILADFDPWRGGLLGFGMLFLAFSPLLAARLRHLPPYGFPEDRQD